MKLGMKTLCLVLALLVAGVASGFASPTAESAGPVTLTVEIFDRTLAGFTPDNSLQSKWIQTEVKKKLGYDVKFVTLPRNQEVDKLNVLMAAGQAPDISFTYDNATIMNYIKQGGLTELTPLLDANAAALVKYMGPDHMWFGNWNGKQWSVPAKRTITACFSAFVRKDWLDKLGMAIPKTNAEFFTMLKAFKDKDPGATGGKVIPWELNVDPNNIDWTSSMLINSFVTKMTKEEQYCLERWQYPGYKEGIRALNTMYDQGLISPDFALDKDGKQYERDVVQGRTGAFQHNYDQPYRAAPGWLTELKKVVPTAEFVPFDPFVNFEGKHAKFKYSSLGLHIIVPKFSKNAVPALKYLNWMSDPSVLLFLQNGTQGVHYLEVKNGIPMNFVDQGKLPDAQKTHWVDYSIIVNGKEFGDDDKNAEAASFGYTPYEALYKQAYKIAYTDATMGPRFDTIIESEAKYRQTLNQKQAEIFVKTITAKPAEFDALYDSLVKEYMSMGGQAITDEKKAAFKVMAAAGGIK